MVAQAAIKLLLPTIYGVGFQARGAAQLDDGRAGLPLLEDGKLLLGGNAVPAPLLTVGLWFICIRVFRPFKLSKSQLVRPIASIFIERVFR